MSVYLRVCAELNDFVRPDQQYRVRRRPFRPHQTVKDVLESAGIPHTEVDLVLINGESVDSATGPGTATGSPRIPSSRRWTLPQRPGSDHVRCASGGSSPTSTSEGWRS